MCTRACCACHARHACIRRACACVRFKPHEHTGVRMILILSVRAHADGIALTPASSAHPACFVQMRVSVLRAHARIVHPDRNRILISPSRLESSESAALCSFFPRATHDINKTCVLSKRYRPCHGPHTSSARWPNTSSGSSGSRAASAAKSAA